MRFIFGANERDSIFAFRLAKELEELDYHYTLYDYGGLCSGKIFQLNFDTNREVNKYKPKMQMKPFVILDALYTQDDELLVYTDCDIRILERIDEIDTKDYDVALTVHPPEYYGGAKAGEGHPNITSYLNAGVIFFYNNDKAKQFIREWVLMMMNDTECGSDQEALTKILIKNCKEEIRPYTSFIWKGIRIKLYPSLVYNYTFIKYTNDKQAKIIHYVGDYSNVLKKYHCKLD